MSMRLGEYTVYQHFSDLTKILRCSAFCNPEAVVHVKMKDRQPRGRYIQKVYC
jgi:hypothetical protein